MIKRHILFFFFASLAVFIMTSAIQKSSGPPGCYSGEPPNTSNCTSCHGGQPNTGSAEILFDLGGAELGYVAGQEYTINVSVKNNGMQAAGFQVIALQENNNTISPGIFTLVEPSRTQKIDRDNPHAHNCGILDRVWITHRFQGIMSDENGESTWSYKWTAPEDYVGNINFYLAALEADYDLTEAGDFTYTRTLTSPGEISNIANAKLFSQQLILFPIPASNLLKVKSESHQINKIQILNVHATLIKEVELINSSALNEVNITLDAFSSGVYLVRVFSLDGLDATKRILVIK
jgi:hypothetical protein